MLLNPSQHPFVANILQIKTKISNAKQELASKRLALQMKQDPRKVWHDDKRYQRGSHDFGINKLKADLAELMCFYRQTVRAQKRAA